MSASILLIEYEPRYVERVRKALEGAYRIHVVADLDAAVEVCAHTEPQAVVVTSVLPRIKIEDAITQLRARAGLRATPFLILMSGYRGSDPRADAARYGAQDILERPFSGEALAERVAKLVESAASPATTQAIPQDMLEALRKTAGIQADESSLTSDDLFGDILSDVETGRESRAGGPHGPGTSKPAGAGPAEDGASGLEDMLKPKPDHQPIRRQAPPSETDVDAILSQTLAGLDIQPPRRKPKPVPPAEPAPSPAEPPGTSYGPAGDAQPPSPPEEPPAQAEAPPPPASKATPPSAPPSAPPTAPPPGPTPPPPEAKPTGPASSGTQFGQYILQEHIATGGMAEVYKARMMGMEGFQKTVAIKRILPHLTDNDEFVTMFIDEAKLAAQLNHNNIIHIYDLGKIDRSHYIAMEYIEGRDLRSILQTLRERKEPIPIPLALYITTLLASALDYAHKKRDFENRELGLVHRDVSPQNVLISNAGDIKLCDFGIAKAASKASHTRAGALKGKLQYMSPEQAWGKDIDLRSDIFSLGLVCYEMLTGDKLFAGDSELSILEQVRNPSVRPPSQVNPDIPSEVERVVLKALEADRNQRYQSAREMQSDLESIMRQEGWTADSTAIARMLQELADGAPLSGRPESRTASTTEPEPEAATPDRPPVVPLAPPPAEFDITPEPEPAPAPTRQAETPAEPATPPAAAPITAPETDAAPEPEMVDDEPETASGGRSNMRWLIIGAVALVVVAVGLYVVFGRGGGQPGPTSAIPPVQVDSEPTPTPEPSTDPGLMSDEEIAAAAAAAAAEIVEEKTDEIRERIEKEFPTPTPIPPTATPTPTPTATETPVPTSTPVPPTPTSPPPTATPIPPTPTPSVREGDIVTMGPGVTAPVLLDQVTPQYPPVALQMRAGGVVTLDVLVGTRGTVEDVRVVEVTRKGMGFETSATEAVRQWRYKPATKNGVKVRMWLKVRVPFKAR